MDADERACPFCAETIKSAAIKCRWCGEFLNAPTSVATSPVPPNPVASRGSTESRADYLNRINSTNLAGTGVSKGRAASESNYTGKVGGRMRLSTVGDRSDGSLKCPRCNGSQFTAKRSNKGKVIGFTTLGVGGLIAPKSQVKCVACGLMFKRN